MFDRDPWIIRPATPDDLEAALAVERAAFGQDEEAELVRMLLADPTAAPTLSLLAWIDDAPVGHVLFTRVEIEGDEEGLACAILAPLAVVPEQQGQGIGDDLVHAALRQSVRDGVTLVFVLGHPTYYPRQGFQPAGRLGLDAPYPIEPKNDDAWMVQELRPGWLGKVRGTVRPAASLRDPKYWVE